MYSKYFLLGVTCCLLIGAGCDRTSSSVPNNSESPIMPTSTQENTSPFQQLGSIEGMLGYPGEQLPPLTICAEETMLKKTYCIDHPGSAGDKDEFFTLNVPAGVYIVYAMPKPTGGADPNLRGYYSEFVICGMDAQKCFSHKPIPIKVESGKTVSKINPVDFYTPIEDGGQINNTSKKVFEASSGQLSFQYPSSWIYQMNNQDILNIQFYANEKQKKNGVSIMNFITPVPDGHLPYNNIVIETKKYPLNNSKGSIEYIVLKECLDEPVDNKPCTVKKQGGSVVAFWDKDKTINVEGDYDYKKLKFQIGQFYMNLPENEIEEKRMLNIFDEVIRSLRFVK